MSVGGRLKGRPLAQHLAHSPPAHCRPPGPTVATTKQRKKKDNARTPRHLMRRAGLHKRAKSLAVRAPSLCVCFFHLWTHTLRRLFVPPFFPCVCLCRTSRSAQMSSRLLLAMDNEKKNKKKKEKDRRQPDCHRPQPFFFAPLWLTFFLLSSCFFSRWTIKARCDARYGKQARQKKEANQRAIRVCPWCG